MIDSTASATIDKILRINDAILDHLSICEEQCHVKGILLEALYHNGINRFRCATNATTEKATGSLGFGQPLEEEQHPND